MGEERLGSQIDTNWQHQETRPCLKVGAFSFWLVTPCRCCCSSLQESISSCSAEGLPASEPSGIWQKKRNFFRAERWKNGDEKLECMAPFFFPSPPHSYISLPPTLTKSLFALVTARLFHLLTLFADLSLTARENVSLSSVRDQSSGQPTNEESHSFSFPLIRKDLLRWPAGEKVQRSMSFVSLVLFLSPLSAFPCLSFQVHM